MTTAEDKRIKKLLKKFLKKTQTLKKSQREKVVML